MALPGNVLVEPFQPAPFDEPDDIPRVPLTTDYELGGTALNDPSFGLQVKDWKFFYTSFDGSVIVGPAAGGAGSVLFTRLGVTEVSGAFDQNMNPAVTFIDGTGAWLWFFDTALNAYTFFELPPGTRTPFLTMDDKRPTANTYNDILLFYVLNTNLVYRQQRNRFAVERILYSFNGPEVDILRVGMNKGLRVQIEVEGPGI
jgi:hypothetical protein